MACIRTFIRLKKTYFIIFFSIFSYNCKAQLTLGTEEIIQNEFYVVHSALDSANTVVNTSNIFVIKGVSDTVWIFGTGYGDPSNNPIESDIRYYKGNAYEPTQNAYYDALQVDSIITNLYGLNKINVKLMFIVPHYHLDHINKEFISSFIDSINYPIMNAKILVHINDSIGATCNSPFCGVQQQNSPYFGVPFHPSWTPSILNLFQTIGSQNDTCNQPLINFNSAIGNWEIKKGDTLHTHGSLNIDNPFLKIRIMGAYPDNCPIEVDWNLIMIHGNLSYVNGIKNFISNNNINIFPNPANHKIIINTINNYQFLEVSIYNLSGERLLTSTNQKEININSLPKGSYLIKVKIDHQLFIKKLIKID